MNNPVVILRRGLFSALMLLLTLGGCPPASDPNSATDPNTAGNGNSTGAGEPGKEVTAAARTALIEQLGAAVSGLSTDDITGTQTAVVQMLKSSAEIQAAGVNPDGSVWAVFTDARPLVVALNQAISQEVLDAENAAAAPKPLNPPGPSAAPAPLKTSRAQDEDGPYSLPLSNQAFVLNGFGLEGDTQAHVNAVAAWLVRRGYVDAAPDHLATVENYKKVQNAGVLYVNGHGGIGYLPVVLGGSVSYEPVFALGTLTDRAPDGSTDAQYADLLDSRELGYLVIPTLLNVPLTFGPVAASRYFITKQFAAEKWDFAPASWVYLDVCDGFDQVFKDACMENGAGLFMSWDLTVRHSDSIESSRYLLTRSLGISDASGATVDPPQRAWDFNAVFSRMQLTSRSNAPQIPGMPADILTESFSLHNTEHNGRAELKFEKKSNVQDPLLQPGIRNMSVDDPNGAVTLLGSFGAEQGTITVGGSAMTIDQWGANTVYGHISPDAHGPVVVSVGDHDSDPRQLTLWQGTVSAVYSGVNSPTQKVEISVQFRGDLQSSRLFPDDPPTFYSNPGFRCIPQNSKLLQAEVSGTIPCTNQGGNYTFSTPNPLVNATYIDVGDDGDGYYFQPGVSEGINLNSTTGDLTCGITFGARQVDGVSSSSNCGGFQTPTLKSLLDINGSDTIHFSHGNYNFSDTLSVTSGDSTVTVVIDLTGSDVPSDSDPR